MLGSDVGYRYLIGLLLSLLYYCLSARKFQNHLSKLLPNILRVAAGRSFSDRVATCNMLCASGFVDGNVFSHNGQAKATRE